MDEGIPPRHRRPEADCASHVSEPSVWRDLRRLAGKSVVYGLGTVLLRSVGLLVLPLYTHYLTPEDYGVVALATTLTAFLTLMYPLSLYSAVSRFHFLSSSEDERRRNNGTIWIAILALGLVVSVCLDQGGARLFHWLYANLPFRPFVRMSIWTAFFTLFNMVPMSLLQAKEQPGAYVGWSIVSLLVTNTLIIVLVAVRHQGAFGYLAATLIANAVLAVPMTVLTLRDAALAFDVAILRRALSFSLPLVPHGLASWALGLSDRAILMHFVSLAAIGLYSLGYQFGSIMIMASGAVTNAWIPFLYKRVADEGDASKPGLTRLVTYYVLVVNAIAVALCLFSRDTIVLLTSAPFHAAAPVVPIVVIGYLWNSLYIVPANFLFVANRTSHLPIATMGGAVLNVVLNLILVPRYGIMAAAWTTLAAFLFMLIVVTLLADRVFPFPYEYRRIALVLISSAVAITGGLTVRAALPLDGLVQVGWLLMFPLVLVLSGFFSSNERESVKAFARRAWGRS
jgi:O-antigen/teichoic acid export membrane protein